MNDINRHIDKVWNNDFRGKPNQLKELLTLIIKSRRRIDVEKTSTEFKLFVTQNLDLITTELNLRWLISVLDTYADCGSPLEKSNATTVSLMFNNYKLFETYLDILNDPAINKKKTDSYRSKNLWAGIRSFNIHEGDMYENLINRLDQNLKSTPVIYKIWRAMMANLENTDNVISRLKKIHKRGLYNI